MKEETMVFHHLSTWILMRLAIPMIVAICLCANQLQAAPVLWVAGDQFNAATANLTTWYDRSSANNHLTTSQGDGPAVVLSTLNSLPIVRTTNDSLDTPGTVQFQTVFTVLNNNQGTTFPLFNTAIGAPTTIKQQLFCKFC